MPYKARDFTCQCGARFTRRAPAGSDLLCIDCSITAYGTYAVQMHQRQGPYYAAWLRAVHRLTGCPLADVGTDNPLPLPRDLDSPGIPT